MFPSLDDIRAVTTSLGWTPDSCLLVCSEEYKTPDLEKLVGVFSFEGPTPEVRAELGIVVFPDQVATLAVASPLLSRLRDIHCEKLIIVLAGNTWLANELLALGFVSSASNQWYVFDPDINNSPREWNNPKNWANPENFNKYRW